MPLSDSGWLPSRRILDTHVVVGVVIPAHDEPAVIGRLLSGLLAGVAQRRPSIVDSMGG
jgi:hypothetical protein